MQVRWIQLPFAPERGGFDEAPLLAALAGSRARRVQEYFFTHEDRPYLGLLVELDDDVRDAVRRDDAHGHREPGAEVEPLGSADRIAHRIGPVDLAVSCR